MDGPAAGAVEDDVREFVSEQCPTGCSIRCVPAGTEDDVGAYRVRVRGQPVGRMSCGCAQMYPYATEIGAEARLEP